MFKNKNSQKVSEKFKSLTGVNPESVSIKNENGKNGTVKFTLNPDEKKTKDFITGYFSPKINETKFYGVQFKKIGLSKKLFLFCENRLFNQKYPYDKYNSK